MAGIAVRMWPAAGGYSHSDSAVSSQIRRLFTSWSITGRATYESSQSHGAQDTPCRTHVPRQSPAALAVTAPWGDWGQCRSALRPTSARGGDPPCPTRPGQPAVDCYTEPRSASRCAMAS